MEEEKSLILFNRIESIYLYFMGRVCERAENAVYHFPQGQPFYTKHVAEIMSGLRDLLGPSVSISSKRVITYIGHDYKLYRSECRDPDYLYIIWTDIQIIAEFVGSGFQGVKNFV
jgi:hypothetical protein